MNQLKFMGAASDRDVHTEAHTKIGAGKINHDAGFNWAYLMFNWGFPPEIEVADWLDFKVTVPIYHEAGIRVFGYIQTSNCVFDGSFKARNWYAKDPNGRKIHYYTGRYMTCLLHPEWLLHLREMVSGVIDSGADGVFFDNPWCGIQPIHFGGSWSGSAGCYCNRCCAAYFDGTKLEIPKQINPLSDQYSRTYLNWRSQLVTQTIASLRDYAQSINEDILVSVNDYNAIMNPSFITHGIDLRGLAKVQDVVMIEDFALPRWERKSEKSRAELVNNAITIRSALSLVGDTPFTTDPYDKGIGFDGVYSSRRFQQGIAEAAACGVPMVVKGTEFIDSNGVFTLLTADMYGPQRRAIKQIHDWLELHSHLFQKRRNIASIGMRYPEGAFKTNWDQIAPLYFGICQTLIFAGIPWRGIANESDLDGLEIIFNFDGNDPEKSEIRVINALELPGWFIPKKSFLANHHKIRGWVSYILSLYYRAYFDNHRIRWMTDRLGITQWFIQSPHFKIPNYNKRRSILDQVGNLPYPWISWTVAPVLIEVWQCEHEIHCHLVNYAAEPQTVTVFFGETVSGNIINLKDNSSDFSGNQLEFELDVYSVLRYQPM